MNKAIIAILCFAIIFLFLTSCVKPNVPPEEEDLVPPKVEEPEPPNNAQEDQGDEDYNLEDIFSDEEEVQPPIIPA